MKVPAKEQRGGFVMGLVVGLLLGLALALGVALYITKVPIPFIDKVPQRTTEQDNAELERNRNWDPNGPLAGKVPPRVAAPGASGTVAGTVAGGGTLPPGIASAPLPPPGVVTGGVPSARPPLRDQAAAPAAAGSAAAAAADPFVYFVQAGAYTRSEEAEQQRARLALMGQVARITERELVGRTVYRVRMGPYGTATELADARKTLSANGLQAMAIKVK